MEKYRSSLEKTERFSNGAPTRRLHGLGSTARCLSQRKNDRIMRTPAVAAARLPITWTRRWRVQRPQAPSSKNPTDSVEKVENVVRPPKKPVTRRSRRASFTGKTAKHPARMPAAKHPTRFAASVPAASPPTLPRPTVRSHRQSAPRAAPAATAAAPSQEMPVTTVRAPQ